MFLFMDAKLLRTRKRLVTLGAFERYFALLFLPIAMGAIKVCYDPEPSSQYFIFKCNAQIQRVFHYLMLLFCQISNDTLQLLTTH